MWNSLSKKIGAAVAVAAFFACTARPAHAIDLQTLISTSGTITVGNLTFSNFGYSVSTGGPAAGQVDVNPFTDAAGNLGLRFTGPFAGLMGLTDETITYKVATNDGSLITDAHLDGNPAITGSIGLAQVVETFDKNFVSAETLPMLQIFDSNGATRLADNGDFVPPVSTVDANKDVLEINGNGFATLSIIDQTYSTSAGGVPVPAGIVLVLSGSPVLGLGYWLRRRQPNAKSAA
jgi:hypothetical protein